MITVGVVNNIQQKSIKCKQYYRIHGLDIVTGIEIQFYKRIVIVFQFTKCLLSYYMDELTREQFLEKARLV